MGYALNGCPVVGLEILYFFNRGAGLPGQPDGRLGADERLRRRAQSWARVAGPVFLAAGSSSRRQKGRAVCPASRPVRHDRQHYRILHCSGQGGRYIWQGMRR